MARKKAYNEQEVLEKAMHLFWRNGYENTSTRMLEKEMGINQFSIYSSFGSKQGVFVESIKLYKKKIKEITTILDNSDNGVEGIKNYFYDFLKFSTDNNMPKGCLLANTVNELGMNGDEVILSEIYSFIDKLKKSFLVKLSKDKTEDTAVLAKQADHLVVSMVGLSLVSKIFDREMLTNYIETIFDNL